MRVTTTDLEHFKQNLEDEGTVFRSRVYFDLNTTPVDEEGVRYLVTLHLTTVIDIEEDMQFLLELHQECGVDYLDATQERNGTEAAQVLMDDLEAFCGASKLKLLPGVVDY